MSNACGQFCQSLPSNVTNVDHAQRTSVWFGFGCLLCFYFIAEIAFYFLLRSIVSSHLEKRDQPPPFIGSPITFLTRVIKSIKLLKSYNFECFIRGFFRGASPDEVRTENFESFLAWAMFVKQLKDLNSVEWKSVQRMFGLFKEKFPSIMSKIKKGYNPAVKHINMSLATNINYAHRPLIWHCFTSKCYSYSMLLSLSLHYSCYRFLLLFLVSSTPRIPEASSGNFEVLVSPWP